MYVRSKPLSPEPFRKMKNSETWIPGKLWNQSEKHMWVLSLFFGCAMVYACRTVMPLCIVSISREFGWEKTDSGTVLSAFYWGYTMTQVLGGYLSDKIGGEIVITTAAVGWSLITFWTPYLLYLSSDKTVSLTIIVISRLLVGCFQGVHYPSISSILSRRVSEHERGTAFGSATSGTTLGTLLSGSIGSVILEMYGWHAAFYVSAITAMAWLLFLRYYLIAKQRRKAMILSVKEMTTNSAGNNEPVPWLILFKRPAFWSMVLAHFCHTWAYHVFISWLPSYFGETFPGAKGWVFNVVPWIITIPTAIFSGWLADRMVERGFSVTFVRKFCATFSLAGVSCFLVLTTMTDSYEASLFCMALAIACCAMHTGGILVNPQDIAPKFAGSVFGIMNMAGAIPGFVGVYIAGHILQVTKSWSIVFLQTAFVGYFGWFFFLMFGTGKQIV